MRQETTSTSTSTSNMQMHEEQVWRGVSLGMGALAAVATAAAVRGGWKLYRGDEPPENPAARSVTWGQALAWSTALGAGMGIARMLAERSAAAGWKAVRGRYPKGLE